MITMSTHTVVQYMKAKFPSMSSYMKNGTIDKKSPQSIGILMGSDSRSKGKLDIGGIDATVVRMLPVNIHVRWGTDQQIFDNKCLEIYNALLLEDANFVIEEANQKIACIEVLDGAHICLNRDDKNICEALIRANFYYYV